jgi:hypothetical protein
MPGANILHEPCGFLYDSEAALAELVHRLLKSRTSLMLPRFKVGSPEAWGVQQWPAGGRRFNKSGGSSLRVPLKGTWDEFEATISSGRRSDLRCYRRRAEKLGKVEFEVVQPEVGTLTPHLEELFRVEASGWKGREGSAILYQPPILRFYTEYAQSAAETGSLRLFFLRVGGKTVAARMGVEHGNRLWDLRLGYDEAFCRCAPGVLLTHETLRYAIERGLEAHEFLGRRKPGRRHWPCEEDEYISMRVIRSPSRAALPRTGRVSACIEGSAQSGARPSEPRQRKGVERHQCASVVPAASEVRDRWIESLKLTFGSPRR